MSDGVGNLLSIPALEPAHSYASDIPRPPKQKTGKTVRIISPHSATSDDDDGLPQSFSPPSRHITSPPPSSTMSPEAHDNESPEDPFSAGSDGTIGSAEDGDTQQNTWSNSGLFQTTSSGPSGMPANPFAKTLASLSTENKPSTINSAGELHPHGVDPSASRPHYDVDDFKRLLLTGEKSTPGMSAVAAPPVSFQSPYNMGDSSSNTDASSITRQSLFEPVADPPHGSPDTSHEGSPLDDDRQQLVGGLQLSSQKSKPSTPRHRHGKLVKVNTLQTVSFEDPSLSFSSSDITPKSSGTPSEVDKPLPPLPPSSNPLGGPGLVIETMKLDPLAVAAHTPSSPTGQKRNPPAPPISRRHSQLKPKSFANSERSTPITEEVMIGPGASSPSPPPTASKAPPPPPPRRAGGLVRVHSSSSASTGASIPPAQSHSSADDANSNLSKHRPPAPPNYSPTISSLKRQQTQPISGSPSVAPPPPPRRRGSSQSSYTPSRLSGDYRTAATERFRSDSGASSISHLQMTPMTPTPSSSEGNDAMADLAALQREVDELRTKFRD